jgi:hypothetical protein
MVIAYPSKGGEKRSLELRINVSKEFIGYPSKAGLVWDSLYTKLIGYPSKLGEKRSLELRMNVRIEFIGYPSKAGLIWGCLYTKAYRVSLKEG